MLLVALCLEGCAWNPAWNPFKKEPEPKKMLPVCQEETTVAVYDDNGAYQVPGCVDYVIPQIYGYAISSEELEKMQREAEAKTEKEEEIDVDKIAGEFPEIYNDKYITGQIVMQNLQTRVLAYCRGTDEEKADCVERLECAGYRKITEVPYLAAKYDYLKKGVYPSRRWRDGESVPRW